MEKLTFWLQDILGDSKTTLNIFGAILGDSRTTLKLFWTILADSQWFMNHSEIILRQFCLGVQIQVNECVWLSWYLYCCSVHTVVWGAQWVCSYKGWVRMYCSLTMAYACAKLWPCYRSQTNSWWFMKHFEFFGAILGDLWTTLKLFWGNSWWFATTLKFLGGGQLLVICEPLWIFELFLAILDDSWWFGNHSQQFQNQKPVWNYFGAILCDSWTSLNFLGQFSVILSDL